MHVEFGVLGPVAAWDDAGGAIALKGPRHRAVLARLIAAAGRTVPMGTLVDDLWTDPPAGAAGAVQTFVSALRRALEPDREPRSPARLLVTEGTGYALRVPAGTVDARRFADAVGAARTLPPERALATLDRAATWWRGPAYADLPDELWARAERARLAELRLASVELRARMLLDLGRADSAVPDLDAHVAEHPWREEGWRLLATALYRAGRQKDALDVLRRARTRLATDLGLDPGPELARLETDVLRHAPHLAGPPPPSTTAPGTAADQVWTEAVATLGRTVGAGARLRSTVDLLRSLAVTGGPGLEASRRQRVAGIAAAEELGDPHLTARVIGAYDVPAVWSRVDDPEQAAAVVAAAERTLAALPAGAPERTRLLTTVALESRGTDDGRGPAAAREAEAAARRTGDPALLAFALDGLFMQSFGRAGLAARRDALGAELVDLAAGRGLESSEVLGRLIRVQARSGLGDLAGAEVHATAADRLAETHGSPLVTVFTTWSRALRTAVDDPDPTAALDAYRRAAATLDDAGMPGLSRGLPALAELAVHVDHRRPVPAVAGTDRGPYEPWTRPLVLLARGRRDEAATALRGVPEPPRDHLLEALWCLVARAATDLGDHDAMRRALAALRPAAGELAGAGSGLITLGPVTRYLDELTDALAR